MDSSASPPPQALGALADAAGSLLVEIQGDPWAEIAGASFDSRKARPGELFFCVPGATSDGHDFAQDVVTAGVGALCVERRVDTSPPVPQLVVSDVRKAMPTVGARVFGDPARDLVLVGVTGTNGKTTTVFLIDSILRAAGKTTGLIGTIETRIAGDVRPGIRTTPESLDLQRLLWEMKGRGVDVVAMEVTSHALSLHRVDGLRFASAAFTNLTQDHLDFHHDMEDYFAAKAGLFVSERADQAAVNLDDTYGRKLKDRTTIPVRTFGVSEGTDVTALDVESGPSGSTFRMVAGEREAKISTSLVGPFNISNCLAAATSALNLGIGLDAIEDGLRAQAVVPGRFESVDCGQPFSVIVDYAHTPDSLANVLEAARAVAVPRGGRVICAFGCGGDRDKGKRPLMGSVVARLADVAIVTSDNPRSEDPMAIIGAILEGVTVVDPDGPAEVLPDRAEAIAAAVSLASPDDMVVIAGKGHETGQQFADHTIDFDDRIVARRELAKHGWDGCA
ncbi:MAG: UDP-N-acetylmuramoyl-L-alanyl-D-glutamate--2,6-diaminopimelate ligase [Actinomycetota bacterium]|nr:UDP-N-acetylmuramoyl-L-alanyl-D-glutamate--2,6-diaminopimelate ligase [Actinomycetota bacterium]